MPEKPTYELVRQQGKEGLKVLYERYGKRLYSYAVSSWKLNEDDAWDITYKVLFNICDKSAGYTFKDEQAFASFLFASFINLLRNHFRDRKQLPEEPLHALPEKDSAEKDPESESMEMQLLQEELGRLEDWERILLLLRCQDMPYSEIARYTGKSPEVLKVYYGRLKDRLGKKLNQLLKQELK